MTPRARRWSRPPAPALGDDPRATTATASAAVDGRADDAVTITVDGAPVTGARGQSIAGVLMADGRRDWRTTSVAARPRGLFCGIGVCFDCIVTVNDLADVRACLRRAQDGDVVTRQHHLLPGADA
ncbi:2Fe-2S iron-sulfur cluster protein [Terracoccus luteus]|uniref:2Fe-2S iron-sulfur cluster protein n=1 Tax=Terracoccus luteus TaxID=53356 RepID=A0A495XWI7_9MICO|nr:2Fe-2S iron-sulfur cluster protein [Terracoccus luteus]